MYGFVLAAAVFTPALWALLAAFFLWGVASHAFGAVQDIVADREGGIASIATVIGGRATVRLAFSAYLLAGMLLLFTRFPGPFGAVLVLPYALTVLPYWNITDADAGVANRGWKRFLFINFVVGFLVTMLLIWYGTLTVGCAGTTIGYSGSYLPLPVGHAELGQARDFVRCR